MSRRPRLRYSLLHVTINTNKSARSAFAETLIMNDLERFFTETLSEPSVWRENELIIIDDYDSIENITVTGIGLEVSPKQKRVHAHCVVQISHRGKVSWRGTGLQRRWQNLVNREVSTNGSYVHISGANSRSLNYMSKDADKLPGGGGVQQRIEF